MPESSSESGVPELLSSSLLLLNSNLGTKLCQLYLRLPNLKDDLLDEEVLGNDMLDRYRCLRRMLLRGSHAWPPRNE